MKNCLVYNFSGELDDYSHLFPNERLGRLAAIVHARGIPVTVVDRGTVDALIDFGADFMTHLGDLGFLETTPEYLERVQQEARTLETDRFDTLFMNLWQGTGFKFAVDLAREIRKQTPGIHIFGVGQRVDWFKEHILTLTGDAFDGLITGLGYDTVDALARGQSPPECPGMLRMDANGAAKLAPRKTIDVDDYPCADYTLYQGMDGKIPLYSVTLSNQACPNRCTYCIRPENYGRKTVSRAPRNVLEELRQLHLTRGARHIRIEDSTPPEGALTDLARSLLDSELAGKLALSAFSRIDTNASEDFALMKEAGFRALFFGIETLDEGQLAAVRKGITFEQMRNTLKRAHDAGIATVGSLIFPLPGETQASMRNTLARIREIQPWLDSLLALPAVVYPPTEWGRHPERFGIQLDDDYYERFAAYPLRYLLPPERWPPVPFSYPVETAEGHGRRFEDILTVYRSFEAVVRQDIGLPFIPDYYYLLADMIGKPPAEATGALVGLMFNRDYTAIRQAFTSLPHHP